MGGPRETGGKVRDKTGKRSSRGYNEREMGREYSAEDKKRGEYGEN